MSAGLTSAEVNALAISAKSDVAASELLFERFRGTVLTLARRKIDGYEVEDLLQEGFIALASAIRTYNEDKGNFYAYARACIEHRLIDTARRSFREKRRADLTAVPLEDTDGASDEMFDQILQRERSAEVRERLVLLSELEREVLKGYLSGSSYKEIAAKLGLEVKAVDNALGRVKKKLGE